MSDYKIWYFPEGKATIFSAVEGLATITNGKLTLKSLDGSVVQEFKLDKSLQLSKASFGSNVTIIKRAGNQDFSTLLIKKGKANMIYHYKPVWNLAFISSLSLGRAQRKAFHAELKAATGVQEA